MFNDSGAKSTLTYFGNAADGTTNEFGTAAGIVGDGTPDGTVERTWWLGAGIIPFSLAVRIPLERASPRIIV
jgi:hypothetical protein